MTGPINDPPPGGPGRNLCDHAWPTTPSHADDRYRQHRCGQPAGHTGPHTCRYQHTGGTR